MESFVPGVSCNVYVEIVAGKLLSLFCLCIPVFFPRLHRGLLENTVGLVDSMEFKLRLKVAINSRYHG